MLVTKIKKKLVKKIKSDGELMRKELAILAGGCFWGIEELIRNLPGVLRTEVGYCGGSTESPIYNQVKTGQTGHAEAIQVEFDSEKISFENLLLYFFKIHDPTTNNQQGNDIGSQYRSAIFYLDEQQKQIAKKVISRVDQSGAWGHPVVTKLEQAVKFFPAEEYHQDYLQKNPEGYTCHFLRKVEF